MLISLGAALGGANNAIACDCHRLYGTIAKDGVLDSTVREAIANARKRGVLVVIVTGRILSELRHVAGCLDFVDGVVAENGAVVALPNGHVTLLGKAPPLPLISKLTERGIDFKVSRCVVEMEADFADVAIELIRELELPLSRTDFGDYRMNTMLFLCTGDYYRSRFAEMYFRHLVTRLEVPWQVESRGLQLDPGNEGPISTLTIQECKRLGVLTDPPRWPLELVEGDLAGATVTIAVKETEHRPLIRKKFPAWEDRIEYWNIHDVDFATADEALPLLRQHVTELVERLMRAQQSCKCAKRGLKGAATRLESTNLKRLLLPSMR